MGHSPQLMVGRYARLLAANVSLLEILGDLEDHEIAMLAGKHDGTMFLLEIIDQINREVAGVNNAGLTYNIHIN